MAAAYAFHICKNHPFVDGNKRAATAAMIMFLSDNGWRFHAPIDEAKRTILALAAGALEKSDLTAWVGAQCRQLPTLELRRFFASLDPDAFVETFLAMRPESEGNRQEEWLASIREVIESNPVVGELAQRNIAATVRGDETGRFTTAVMILTLASIHRVAESLGYEW